MDRSTKMTEEEFDAAIQELFEGRLDQTPEATIPPPDWSRLSSKDMQLMREKIQDLCPLENLRKGVYKCMGYNPVRYLFPRSYCLNEMRAYAMCSNTVENYYIARKPLFLTYLNLIYKAKYDGDNFEDAYKLARGLLEEKKDMTVLEQPKESIKHPF